MYVKEWLHSWLGTSYAKIMRTENDVYTVVWWLLNKWKQWLTDELVIVDKGEGMHWLPYIYIWKENRMMWFVFIFSLCIIYVDLINVIMKCITLNYKYVFQLHTGLYNHIIICMLILIVLYFKPSMQVWN
jgi:hypothetical protein